MWVIPTLLVNPHRKFKNNNVQINRKNTDCLNV